MLTAQRSSAVAATSAAQLAKLRVNSIHLVVAALTYERLFPASLFTPVTLKNIKESAFQFSSSGGGGGGETAPRGKSAAPADSDEFSALIDIKRLEVQAVQSWFDKPITAAVRSSLLSSLTFSIRRIVGSEPASDEIVESYVFNVGSFRDDKETETSLYSALSAILRNARTHASLSPSLLSEDDESSPPTSKRSGVYEKNLYIAMSVVLLERRPTGDVDDDSLSAEIRDLIALFDEHDPSSLPSSSSSKRKRPSRTSSSSDGALQRIHLPPRLLVSYHAATDAASAADGFDSGGANLGTVGGLNISARVFGRGVRLPPPLLPPAFAAAPSSTATPLPRLAPASGGASAPPPAAVPGSRAFVSLPCFPKLRICLLQRGPRFSDGSYLVELACPAPSPPRLLPSAAQAAGGEGGLRLWVPESALRSFDDVRADIKAGVWRSVQQAGEDQGSGGGRYGGGGSLRKSMIDRWATGDRGLVEALAAGLKVNTKVVEAALQLMDFNSMILVGEGEEEEDVRKTLFSHVLFPLHLRKA